MPCLLLTLGVALVCSVQATDIPQTKQNLELPKSALRVHVISLWPTPEDHLEIVLHRWENNSCVEKKVLGEKTENPKKFKINCRAPGAPQLSWKPQGPRTDPASSTARVLVEDDEIMKGFIRAFRPLHKRLWYLLDLRKTEEPCHF
ncbi:glycodelin-like isoform X2 [Theropithecus gelada]|uniref:glycodelin-like isoform X2 n=1 Tax=Theropithecus gelada TaxID=9565 RepID=UPI000DC176F9|nr:glycodelin-like isoform X2 [Theropithecus gelada]